MIGWLPRLVTPLGVVVVSVGLALAQGVPASADHRGGHMPPQGPAKVAFASDFPALVDHEWDFALGGFGGIAAAGPRQHLPVIFVHGNNVDAADWYPVRDDFLAAGWTDQELWGLSYNGLGANNGSAIGRANPERDAEHTEMGWDGTARVTANDINVPDLVDFVAAVRTYTGAAKVHLVSHSLGVTLARKAMFVDPDLADAVASFVAIAGANDGTSFCPPGSESQVHSCDEIAAGTSWLEELNGPNGDFETYGATKWLTIYDGSGYGDPAYVGPTYADSPMLRGAENVAFPGVYHNDLRIRADIVAFYREWIESVDLGLRTPPEARSASTAPSPRAVAVGDPGTPLPVTGAGAGALALVVSLFAGRGRRRARLGVG